MRERKGTVVEFLRKRLSNESTSKYLIPNPPWIQYFFWRTSLLKALAWHTCGSWLDRKVQKAPGDNYPQPLFMTLSQGNQRRQDLTREQGILDENRPSVKRWTTSCIYWKLTARLALTLSNNTVLGSSQGNPTGKILPITIHYMHHSGNWNHNLGVASATLLPTESHRITINEEQATGLSKLGF